ncbi:MAG: hypothetical protein V7L21_34455 [Nostoc sp.]|uniref:hypothetical protein n=1 Tax=unclassified Nostoc TaxID=2593658 RepID=UPI0025E23EA1|nr:MULTISPECIES: hypothetical protein [unclassified Nostoc]MBN3941459.1 hypothetical protein [Nostoc sp. NMS9]MDZ8231925.1 hypothetical protein [Nostoc sp. ChiQUE02]
MWLKVVELAGKKVPTGRIVKDMVQRIERLLAARVSADAALDRSPCTNIFRFAGG